MPYRRSRLQDYYEELLGPDPSDEGGPAEPEAEESESWLPSYIPPIEPPTPGLTSGESDRDGRPAPPLDVDPAVQDYERNLYQRLGINRADQDRQSPDKADEQAQQPPVNASPPLPTIPPDIVDYEQGLYDRLGLIPPHPTKPQFPVVPIESPVDRIPEDIDMYEFLPLSGAETGAEPGHWQANTPLTQGQAMHVEHLLNVETDHLALEALLTLQRDGLPPRGQWKEFMSSYALTGWDAESDAIAWATLAAIAHSDWDEWLGHSDSASVESIAQDLGNDWIEGLAVIDANSGQTLLNRTGVVRADGSQYVGLQDYEAEALKGRDLIFVHNHPNGTEASDEDLDSAYRAGAELLIVITAQGQEFVYIRGRSGMVKVRDDKASYEMGPATLDEALYLLSESLAQARVLRTDPAELIFRQDDPSQLESEIYVPIGLTSEQANEMLNSALAANVKSGYMFGPSQWEASWVGNPEKWPEYEILTDLLESYITDVARQWNHPALGMSDNEVALLLLAHLRQEGHYRGEGGLFNDAKNWLSRTSGGNPSVGPANVRIPVANEILGTHDKAPHIPMPPGYAEPEFDDMGGLDDVQRDWPNLDASEREDRLEDDETAIRLTAANIFRAAERLFVLYLYDRFEVKPAEDIQDYLKEHGHQRDDLIRDYLQQEDFRASMFNMLGWLSQGIAESHTLRSGSSGAVEPARRHASGGVRSIHAILVHSSFGLTMDADDVRLFNDDDIYAYRLP